MKKVWMILWVIIAICIVVMVGLDIVDSQSTAIIDLVPDDDGLGGVWYWIATPTARVITAVPGPSQTPWVVTVTSIASSTSTPTPTNTSTPVATAIIEPSPTPEDLRTPSATPEPTMTYPPTLMPTDIPGCLVQNKNTFSIFVRSLPLVSSTTYIYDLQGQREYVSPNTYLHPDAVYVGNGYTWYKHWWKIDGDTNNAVYAWTVADYFTVVSGTCDDLPYEDPFEVTAIVRDGPHTIAGEGGSVPLNYSSAISAGKYTEGTFQLGNTLKAANPNVWLVARLYTDCIAHDNDYNVDIVWDKVKNGIPQGYDAFELENECMPNDVEDLERWSEFSINFAQRLAAEKNMQYLAFGFGPGWPAFDKLKYIVPYLRWVDENPLSGGRYHGVASHASVFAPWNRSDMPWVNESYIAGRVYLIRDWIYTITPDDFDLYKWHGVWAITEIGLSDGYSGNWSAPYTCSEVSSAYHTTTQTYKDHAFPHVLLWWNFGKLGIWTSDHDCAEAIWRQ